MTEPPLAEVFRGYFEGLEEQRLGNLAGGLFHQCFGCGPLHPAGLRVRSFKTASGVASPIFIPRQYEGPPGVAHGGIVAAYLDEVLAAAVVRATGGVAVTGELTVRYLKPVPTEAAIIGHAALVADQGRFMDAEGRLEELGTEQLLATARGRFFPIKTLA